MIAVVGEDTSKVIRQSCGRCASVLEFTLADAEEIRHYDYTGDLDKYYTITCPKCKHTFPVKRANL
jgi:hypothetical protein